ncbi:DDE-type integrase/transposase/recombinase [Nostoc punctiforme FACHB-252]|uniref:DDE-type integrase/transposase/recombinase n=1 Tax=Nostoc punctiforme FACHB-252 TaxID=1357509 RepID=A0ABR8HM78_NOSPU|nr:Mu transposase C-terminal domain-containing protein [Nostoc punctiforme]MBD2616471.1 DDE-type integrase/transposase/recombinase [Nostoc punctiforme FACHB-252]
MLSDQEFNDWCRGVNLPQAARQLISQIRASEPIRRVKSSGINVRGDYASRKMGKTIQFESHKIELPGVEEYEEDADVLEYYDQAYQITLEFPSSNGEIIKASHIPDFFVIRNQSAGFEEWKPESRLEKLAAKQSQRYMRSEDGQWLNLPAVAYAEKLGLYYRIRLDTEIDWIKYRNRLFLKAYATEDYQIDPEIAENLVKLISLNPGISYWEMIHTQQSNPDDINALIATQKIYINLSAAPLAEPEKVQLFRDQEIAVAYVQMMKSQPNNGTILNILDVKPNQLEPKTYNQVKMSPKAMERFLKASPEDLAEANRRYEVIEPYLNDSYRDKETVPQRTIRRWKAKFIAAQKAYRCGYIGLLNNSNARGNRLPRISQSSQDFIDKIIEEYYETFQQRRKLAVYGILAREWEKAGLTDKLPSYATFCSRIQHRSGYRQTKKRKGNRAAYQQSLLYWELKLTTPCHGDRPFEIAHIDHTQLDIELVCSRTGYLLGRPWATLLIDAYSRRILAVYLTFDEPSYRSCMMVLRICVQRFEKLPETIVVDGGTEFSSTYFETLLAAFECTKKQRPAAKARFGSIVERIFGTTNTEFFYNLRGNTQITKNVRQVTKSNNPKNQAVWTLDQLYEHFCSYCYEFYDCKEHPTLGQSPRQTFMLGLNSSGSRPQKQIIYDDNFKIFTLPSTPKGTAKVQPSRGVKINYLYYWSIDDSFLRPEIEGTNVPIRYDPFDMGTAYAYVKGRWIRCISEYYKSFQNRSEKEVNIASTQLRRKRQKHTQRLTLSAQEKATYLEGTEAQETLLLQRLHDLAQQDVWVLIEKNSVIESKSSKHNYSANVQDVDKNILAGSESIKKPKSSAKKLIDLTKIEAYNTEELW